jgi:hypothetical protein
MPIDYKRYPPEWDAISRFIRHERAGNKCEWCGIANGAPLPSGRKGKVVLTVAHLGTTHPDGTPGDKHDKFDVRHENLAALCNRCHLNYDQNDHMQHAKETRQRKKRELIEASGQLAMFGE